MKQKLHILILLLAAAVTSACNNYEKVPENDMFAVSLKATDARAGVPLPFTVFLDEGADEGECRMTLSIRKDGGAAIKPHTIYLNGESEIDENSKWSFVDGSMDFTIEGLDAGNYTMTAYVTRWYHTASATTTFKVK